MHYFKLVGNDFRSLWENREALDKYLERLEELMNEDEKEKQQSDSDLNRRAGRGVDDSGLLNRKV